MTNGHRLNPRLANEIENEMNTFPRALDILLELCDPVCLDALRQSPPKARNNANFSVLQGFVLLCLPEFDKLLDTHDLEIVQIPRPTLDNLSEGVDLALLNEI